MGNVIRESYELIAMCEREMLALAPQDRTGFADFIAHEKRALRKRLRVVRMNADRIAQNMVGRWKIWVTRDGETVYEYSLFNWGGFTDSEKDRMCEEMVEHNYSPYDCSGKLVTAWITWHDNPNGLTSVVHCKGLDV